MGYAKFFEKEISKMKKCKGLFFMLFIIATVILSSCGKMSYDQDYEEEMSEEDMQIPADGGKTEETTGNESNPIVLHWEYPYMNYQPIEQVWEKDYSSAEWEEGKCLNVYVMICDMEMQDIIAIEEELNHRLHMAGEDFYIHFYGPTYQEMYGEDWQGGQTSDELVRQRRSDGVSIDIWVTDNYPSTVQNGEILELTNYLQSTEGKGLYDNFGDCVWEQVMDSERKIYGVPMNPVAVCRDVYSYTPQLMEQLSIDMSPSCGDPKELENLFPDLLQQGVLPVEVEMMEDALMLSMLGLENYGGVLAIRHEGDDWEAVDLWAEEEAISFYNQLGDWREKGFLEYTPELLNQMKEISGLEMDDDSGSDRYPYRLFRLEERETITWNHVINFSETEDGSTATKYAVPDQPAYSSCQWIQRWGAMVISAQTEYPEECMRFIKNLFTDPEIRLLLYKGIEGEHYVWRDGVLMNGSAYGFPIGLGFSQDLRFWPTGDWGARYTDDIISMNRNVSPGLGLTRPYILSEDPELSDKESACRRIIEENRPVFLGYYGNETLEKLEEVHEQLVEAGYLELIEEVNSGRADE